MLAMREVLVQLYWAAIDAVRGERVLRECSRVDGDRWLYDGPGGACDVALPTGSGRLIVAGAGKAAASMARGLEAMFGDRISAGLMIVKHGHALPLQRIAVREASHPVPDVTSVDATRALLRMLQDSAPGDLVFFLLTGGASSLLCAPVDGITLADKAHATRLLINGGTDIREMNVVRKHLSAVKGGRLRAQTGARTVCTLAISDVVGDDPQIIGSGPTVTDTSTPGDALAVIQRHELTGRMPPHVIDHLQQARTSHCTEDAHRDCYRIVGSNRAALDACAELARGLGCDVTVLTDRMTGDTRDAAARFSATLIEYAARPHRRPHVVVAGGETTLHVTGTGRGGRNQEFALRAALALDGIRNVALLAAGTDGTDGPTDAAGAFADRGTLTRAARTVGGIEAHLRNNDAYPLLESLGDLFITGPTHTNVMDLVIGIVW